ncbi:MAG TPA: hypothetical protein VH092_06310 [Urbifossiella sp.]|nr:hypothetical protein [Urbifossiella sp.]
MPGSTCFTDENPPCPTCDGPGLPLGRLRTLDHWTCRDCGLQFHTPALIDEDPDGDYPDW